MSAASLRVFVLLFLVCAAASSGSAATLYGKVVGVKDGDTLVVLSDARVQTVVRLAEIDAPERRQPYGNKAKQALSRMSFGKRVAVLVTGHDQYGRALAHVRVDDVDVNVEMVRLGAAWVYRRYSEDAGLLALEAEAREARRGLWALPKAEQLAPWDWRALHRAE